MSAISLEQFRNIVKKRARVFPERPKKCFRGSPITFRSSWEVKVADQLENQLVRLQITNWEYEPQTFYFENIKRGTRSYTPDFKVTRLNGTHYWIEVKGYMDQKSKTKIKRFLKYYPEEQLMIYDKTYFR